VQDIFNDITVPRSYTADLASSSLHSPQVASESSVPVQPLYMFAWMRQQVVRAYDTSEDCHQTLFIFVILRNIW